MKGGMLGSRACMTAILLVLIMMSLITRSPAYLIGAGCFVLIPLFSFAVNAALSKRITISFESAPTSPRAEASEITLIAENTGRLGAGKLCCAVEIKNAMTGDTFVHTVETSVLPKAKSRAAFIMQSQYCGLVTASLKRAYITGWLGVMTTTVKSDAKSEITVLPDTFSPHIVISVPAPAPEEDEAYSPDIKGYDCSEVFQLRDYVPGDSLRQIHWKLSEKVERLVVRDGSLPAARSMLIFWDKNAARATASEMNTMAEAVSSVCRALTDRGIVYTLGWCAGHETVLEEISDTEGLLAAIPLMLKTGYADGESSGVVMYTEQYGRSRYGKTVCIAAAVPEGTDSFRSSDFRLLLCVGETDGNLEASADIPAVVFSPKTYISDLQSIEL